MMKVVVNLQIFAMSSPGQNQLVIEGRWLHRLSNNKLKVYEFMCDLVKNSWLLYVFSSLDLSISTLPTLRLTLRQSGQNINISLDSEFS